MKTCLLRRPKSRKTQGSGNKNSEIQASNLQGQPDPKTASPRSNLGSSQPDPAGPPSGGNCAILLVFTMQTGLMVQKSQVCPRFWGPPGRGPRHRRRATQGKLGTRGQLDTQGQLDRPFRLHGLVRRRTRTQLID